MLPIGSLMNMPSIYNELPVIGITSCRQYLPKVTEGRTEADLYTLAVEYVAVIRRAGGLPVILPHGTPEDGAKYVDELDGLVLSGGGDIDPKSYGETNEGLSYDTNYAVDQFEMALIHAAKERNIPTLGICRGLQMLSVAFGGKMYQELHDIYPHHPRVKGKTREEIMVLRHKVNLKPGSQLAQVYGGTEIVVNSIHHQCIRTVGEGFEAVGWSEDGIIEAIESTGDWVSWGVQWHPEKLEASPAIIETFVKEVKRSMVDRRR